MIFTAKELFAERKQFRRWRETRFMVTTELRFGVEGSSSNLYGRLEEAPLSLRK